MLACDTYVRPRSLTDALAVVAASEGGFRFAPGATDLLLWPRKRPCGRRARARLYCS
jgi:hypothetical protein